MRAANFVEETTTSIAGTGGNGAVTLTAVTGRPRFSTVFGTQATTVRYVIEDTTNGKFETGVGVVSANVLTRTRPQVTWDGTTYDDSTPSPLAFGSAPASGNVRVRISATAESQGVVIPGANRSIGGDSWRDYQITNSVGWDNNGGGASLGANVEYYTCYENAAAGLLDGIQFDVVTGASGSMKLALYSVGANGLPASKIVDFNVANVATTGLKTDTATGTWGPAGGVWLPPGWYYIGFIASAACSIRGFSSGGSWSIKKKTPLGREGGYGWGNTVSASGSYSSGLPASPSPGSIIGAGNALSVPWIGLRVTP